MSREFPYQALLINKGLYDLRMAVSRVSRLKFSVRSFVRQCGLRLARAAAARRTLACERGDAAAHADGAEHQVGERADQERRIVERRHHAKFGYA